MTGIVTGVIHHEICFPYAFDNALDNTENAVLVSRLTGYQIYQYFLEGLLHEGTTLIFMCT